MFYVYIIEDQTTHSRYIGYTSHLKQRFCQHQNREVYTTKHWSALRLIYAEYYLNKKDAEGRERFLKSGAGWRFLKKQLRHYLDE
jgi:putative endonuclease